MFNPRIFNNEITDEDEIEMIRVETKLGEHVFEGLNRGIRVQDYYPGDEYREDEEICDLNFN